MPDNEPNETPDAQPESAQPAPEEAPSPEGAASEDAGSLAEEALAAATEALNAIDSDADDAPISDATATDEAGADSTAASIDAFAAPDFGANGAPRELPEGLDLLADVNLNVKIELGRTRMLVEDVLRLNQGSVVELDKLAGDPVDIYVNDRPVARGEVLVLNDNFCVRISEIISHTADAESDTPASGAA